MTAIVLLVVIIALVGAGAWLRQRRSDREISSVDRHRSTLSTLGGMQRAGDLSAIRRARPMGSGRALPMVDPSVDHVHAEVRPDGERVFVFDDAKPYSAAAAVLDAAEQRRADWAINHMASHHRTRHPLGLWVAVGLLAVVVAIGALVEHQTTAAPLVTLPAPTTTSSTTSTTLPPDEHPIAAGAGTATYLAGAASYTVTIDPAGPCWVQVAATGSNATLFAATVQPGKGAAIALTSGAAVSIGSPSGVRVLLDGTPLQLPSLASPTVLTFTVPTTSTTTSTVPISTTTLPPNALTGG